MVTVDDKNMINLKSKIKTYLKANGPSLIGDIAKYIQKDSIITSAILSEMVSSHEIEMSHLRIGTSQLYYLKEHKRLLEKFTNYLKKNEYDAFLLIKNKKLIRSDELLPQQRVSMGYIKDFAIPIKVITSDGRKNDYWKFYSLTNDDVYKLLKENRKELNKENPPINNNLKNNTLNYKGNNNLKTNELNPTSYETKEFNNPDTKSINKEEKTNQDNQLTNKPINDSLIKEYANSHLKYYDSSIFFIKVIKTLIKNKITATDIEFVKKGKEYRFNAFINLTFGNINLYCIAKSKKSISEQDIKSLAYDILMKNKLIILISDGKLSKKTSDIINKNNLIYFISTNT